MPSSSFSLTPSPFSLIPPNKHTPLTLTLTLTPKPYPLHRFSVKSSLKKSPEPSSSSWVSPDWLTSLSRSLSVRKDDSGIPIASAKLDDVSDLLGGALFLPLFKWMEENGPIYRLAAGPKDFVVVSDPAIAKHVLKNYGKYAKGLVAEVSEFLFGSGFAIAEGPLWTVMITCLY
jgi:carotene epsilon-monooxygenase